MVRTSCFILCFCIAASLASAEIPHSEALITGIGDTPMLLRARDELAIALHDLYGLKVVEQSVCPAVQIIVGQHAYHALRESLGLPALVVDSASPEAYCIHFGGEPLRSPRPLGGDETVTLPPVRTAVILGNDPAGTHYGLLQANAMLYEAWAYHRRWPATVTLQRAPLVPLRGMYAHNLYAHAYPYAPRRWTPEEHAMYLETLAGFGYNVFKFTPGISVMETPLSDLDRQGLDYFLAIRQRAREQLGMQFWAGDAANNLLVEPQRVPILERGLGGIDWVNPGDPAKRDALLDNREQLFRYWPDLDAFWIIDGDPGGYPGSPAEDFVNLLLGLRERMNRARPEGTRTALVYWEWTTWSPDVDADNGRIVLEQLKANNPEPWYVMVSNQNALNNAAKAGVLDRTIYYPYHLVEYEPHGPFTAPRFEDIQVEINRGYDGGARQGSFCNTMSPLIQLPNTAYYQALLWHPRDRQPEAATVIRSLAAQVIPEHADILAAAWLALPTDPQSPLVLLAKQALDRLLAEQRDLGILGPVGRRWFPSVRYHLECLSQMLAVHLTAGPARDAIRDLGFAEPATEDAIVAYIRAYLEWIPRTGYSHPRRLLTGKGYDWIRWEIIKRIEADRSLEPLARQMLHRVEARTRDLDANMAAVAVRQISRGVVNFDDADEGRRPSLQTGDILVIDVGGQLAAVVRDLTHSTYTHCGIVREATEGTMVIEGTDPVREVPLEAFLGQARDGHYVHLRVPDLPPERIRRVIEVAESFIGRPYDYVMEWDDEKIYCSELVFKAFQRGAGLLLGERHPIRALDYRPHEEFIRAHTPDRSLPLDRMVITPAELVRTPHTRILYNSFPR